MSNSFSESKHKTSVFQPKAENIVFTCSTISSADFLKLIDSWPDISRILLNAWYKALPVLFPSIFLKFRFRFWGLLNSNFSTSDLVSLSRIKSSLASKLFSSASRGRLTFNFKESIFSAESSSVVELSSCFLRLFFTPSTDTSISFKVCHILNSWNRGEERGITRLPIVLIFFLPSISTSICRLSNSQIFIKPFWLFKRRW